ncbi:MAG: hypothetical protein LBQ75_06675 [Zoogloeaceae bacterium]|nr:hypothetical protein [Zoogloeaceae bacterium]
MTSQRWFGSLLFLALLAMVSGCETISYEYVAPSSPEDKQCAIGCISTQEQCRDNERQRVESERLVAEDARRACEIEEDAVELACLREARGKEGKRRCEEDRRSCSVRVRKEDFGQCELGYKRCFTTCGGEIYKVTTKKDQVIGRQKLLFQ